MSECDAHPARRAAVADRGKRPSASKRSPSPSASASSSRSTQVSLKVRAGTFHALLGENGAGKTTLVKCIMGYYQADAGELIVDDRAGGHRQSARGARARPRHGLSALHAGAGDDGRGEFRAGARRRAGGGRLDARAQARWKSSWRACRSACRSTPRFPRSPPASGRSAKSSSSFISSAAFSSSTSRPRCSRPARPTKCSACCAAWWRRAI